MRLTNAINQSSVSYTPQQATTVPQIPPVMQYPGQQQVQPTWNPPQYGGAPVPTSAAQPQNRVQSKLDYYRAKYGQGGGSNEDRIPM